MKDTRKGYIKTIMQFYIYYWLQQTKQVFHKSGPLHLFTARELFGVIFIQRSSGYSVGVWGYGNVQILPNAPNNAQFSFFSVEADTIFWCSASSKH